MILSLEMAALDATNSDIVRGSCSTFVKSALACNRICQQQRSNQSVLVQYSDRTLDFPSFYMGVTRKDKDPVPAKQKSQCYWFPYVGLSGDPTWITPHDVSLAGIPPGSFDFRDTTSSSGNPFGTKKTPNPTWVNAPLTGSRLGTCFRALLVKFCGLTPVQAKKYTYGSLRCFLPRVAKGMRGEPPGSQRDRTLVRQLGQEAPPVQGRFQPCSRHGRYLRRGRDL